MNQDKNNAPSPPLTGRPLVTVKVARGAGLHFQAHNYAWVPEFTVKTGRRIDLMGLSPKGQFWAVEVKSSLEDFRVDDKWPEYLAFCDQFSFAVAPDFPVEVLPDDVGIIITDGFEHFQKRKPKATGALSGAGRKSLLIQFARASAHKGQHLRNRLLALGDTDTESAEIGDN